MDAGTRKKAREALRRILEAASFSVDDMDDPLAVSAIGGGACLVTLFSEEQAEIDHFVRTNFRLQDSGNTLTCRKLLLTFREGMRADNCIVWGRDEFMRFAGGAALADLLGHPLRIPFEQGSGEATPQSGHVPIAQEQPEEELGPELLHLPLKVDAPRAIRIAGIEGSPKLRLIPHWRYHITSSGEKTFKDKLISFKADRWGAFNAINGLVLEIPMDKAESSGVPVSAEVVRPKNEKAEAETRVVTDLMEQLTQRIKVRVERGDAIYYEERIFKPERKDIKVDIDLVYIPVWQVRGKKIVEVNGSTGEILSAPMDEGVELL
jgi:hypothetical protein